MTGLWAFLIAFPELFLSPSSLSGPLQPFSVLYRFHHPAAPVEGWATAYARPYGVSGLHYLAIGWGTENWFLGAEDLGEQDLGESTIYLSIRPPLPVASGLTLRATSLRGSGGPWQFTLDGGFAFGTPEVRLAFTTRGLLGTDFTPASALLSGAWAAFPGIQTFLDLQLVAGQRPSLITGVALKLTERLSATTGMATAPPMYFVTFRLATAPFTFAYLLSLHTYLGFSHGIEISSLSHRSPVRE